MSCKNGSGELIKIKKYANRRLYNTQSSTYVTHQDLTNLVRKGDTFVVSDAKTGKDLTHSVLIQIMFEQETKGINLLSIGFLRQLIRFYGDSMQSFVPGYLDFSLQSLSNDQDCIKDKMSKVLGAPYEVMENHVRRNMGMFTDALSMLATFQPPNGVRPPRQEGSTKGIDGDITALQQQLSAIQDQLNRMNKKSE